MGKVLWSLDGRMEKTIKLIKLDYGPDEVFYKIIEEYWEFYSFQEGSIRVWDEEIVIMAVQRYCFRREFRFYWRYVLTHCSGIGYWHLTTSPEVTWSTSYWVCMAYAKTAAFEPSTPPWYSSRASSYNSHIITNDKFELK